MWPVPKQCDTRFCLCTNSSWKGKSKLIITWRSKLCWPPLSVIYAISYSWKPVLKALHWQMEFRSGLVGNLRTVGSLFLLYTLFFVLHNWFRCSKLVRRDSGPNQIRPISYRGKKPVSTGIGADSITWPGAKPSFEHGPRTGELGIGRVSIVARMYCQERTSNMQTFIY